MSALNVIQENRIRYHPLPPFENRPFRYQTDNVVVTENDVEKSLAALKPSKSQGPDLFHPKFLKETKDNITKPLKTIFQKSMDESILPPIWKKANISAIFKKGEKKKPENYRPISLTSVPCKLMEKLVRDIIVRHRQRTTYSQIHSMVSLRENLV